MYHYNSMVSHPRELDKWLTYLLDNSESPELMLEVIALHRTETATMLLTAAARHVTDPRYTGLIAAAERYHHLVMDDTDDLADDDRDDMAMAAAEFN